MTLVKQKPQKLPFLINKIQKNIDESIDLIQDYFQLEQYKHSKFLKHSPFFLNSLINEIIEELAYDLENKKIKLKLHLPNKNLKIKTNKEWLKKALLNIIHNAIKYNKEQGLLIITVEEKKNGYLLIIQDYGQGIKEEERNKIFNIYYTKDKKYGTGIGLNFSKTVIENLGGKITFKSQENIGTIFYIYLPKISKKIKLKILASAFAILFLALLFVIDYFYCLIPQKIKIETFDNLKIIKFENGIIAKANKNDKFEIIAYKNILNTKTRNKIIIKKSDMEIATNGNKIKIITPNATFSNLGTKFETVANKTTATSVFNGKIKAKNLIVNTNQGLLIDKKPKKVPLPLKVTNVKITNKPKLIITWESKYKKFKILIGKDINFSKIPIFEYTTTQKELIPNIPDGEWYLNIKSEDKNLFSMPVIVKFISLNNYYTALNYYKHNNLKKAEIFIKKSIKTINKKSAKPYFLYAKILFDLNKYNMALKYLTEGEKLDKKNNQFKLLKAEILLKNHKYKQVIKVLPSPKTVNEKLMVAEAYYHLGKIKEANKYLYQILEKDPDNKKALKLLTIPKDLKKEGLFNGIN